MTLTRVLAVAITTGVGAASFALSFTALRDLAVRGQVPPQQAWLWPLMVDGAILLATLGVVVVSGDPQCRSDRRFFWLVLGGGAVVSIACNALHAILPADEPINTWLRGFLAGVAPTALVVTTDGLTRLTRLHRRGVAAAAAVAFRPVPESDAAVASAAVVDSAAIDTDTVPAEHRADIPTDSRWHEAAARVLEHVSLKNTGLPEVAQVLWLSYERAVTNREIGRRLGISHHTVGKIISTAANHVLHDEQAAVLAAS
jgi:hypothetical protein